MTALNETATAALRGRFRGALLRPGEEGYDEARRVWNGAVDRRPALIARCAGADDVVEAVRFARDQDLELSVRGGGHSISGFSVCDGGLMVDLSLMKQVRVDPQKRTATAAGGLLWGELDRATQAFGLATTGGMISSTGIGGLTLGGGLGHLMRKHGLTVDNLLAVELVTAEGELVNVDVGSDPDLFWGLRGGGGNFGVATRFTYQLHPVGPLVLGGPLLWPLEQAPDVLSQVRKLAFELPDEVGLTIVIAPAPPAPFVPPDRYGRPVVGLLPLWSGDIEQGMRALAPLRAIGKPLADVVAPVPYPAIQSMFDGGAPHGRHYYWKAHRLPELNDDVIGIFCDRMAAPTSPFAQINGWYVGGAVSRVAPDATAVGDRNPGYEMSVSVGWPGSDPRRDEHRSWVRDTWDALAPHGEGVYANFISDEGVAGVEYAYGDRLARLRALKRVHDPDNVFRNNNNIAPA